jgi:hypothetical protein
MSKYTVYKLHQKKEKMSYIRLIYNEITESGELLYFNTAYKLTDETKSKKDSNLGTWKGVLFDLPDHNNLGFTDFLYLNDSVIVFSANINKKRLLHLCFYYSGEIIEINVKDAPHKYFICNITAAYNMLDKSQCIFGTKDQNEQCDILSYSFINKRTQSLRPLFKMEPDWDRCIYTMQNPKGEGEPDFIRCMSKFKIVVFEYEELYGFDKYIY